MASTSGIHENHRVQNSSDKRGSQSSLVSNSSTESFSTKNNRDVNRESGSKLRQKQIVSEFPEISSKYLADMMDSDSAKLLASAKHFHQLVLKPDPPINQLIDSGILGRCVKLMQFKVRSLQIESAAIVAVIASRSPAFANKVVIAQAVPVLIGLLEPTATSSCEEVLKDAIWALGSIADGSFSGRDFLLESGILKPLLGVTRCTKTPGVIQRCIRTLGSLWGGNCCLQDLSQVNSVIKVVSHLLLSKNPETFSDACRAMLYLSTLAKSDVADHFNMDICNQLVSVLTINGQRKEVILTTLRIIGRVLEISQCLVNNFIQSSLLLHLQVCLKFSGQEETVQQIVNQISTILIQIATRSPVLKEMVITHGFVRLLAAYLSQNAGDNDRDVRKAIIFILSPGTSESETAGIKWIVESNLGQPLLQLISTGDAKKLTNVADGLAVLHNFCQQRISRRQSIG